VVASIEGSRPLLVEVQALVAPTHFANPQRVAQGVDIRRLAVVIAVLEKRAGLSLAGADVFVNVAGGIRLEEPAADLGLALALASSFRDLALPPDLVAIGEVGLGGAGDGRRMGSLGPKLLVPVGGRPALERVLEAFLEVESVGEIVAVIPESLMAQAKRAIASRPNPRGARLGVVTGGATRQESV